MRALIKRKDRVALRQAWTDDFGLGCNLPAGSVGTVEAITIHYPTPVRVRFDGYTGDDAVVDFSRKSLLLLRGSAENKQGPEGKILWPFLLFWRSVLSADGRTTAEH